MINELEPGEVDIIDFSDYEDTYLRYAARDNEGLVVDFESEKARCIEMIPILDKYLWKAAGYGYTGDPAYISAEIYRNHGSKLTEFTLSIQGYTPYATKIFEHPFYACVYNGPIGYSDHFDSFKGAVQCLLNILDGKQEIELPEQIIIGGADDGIVD